MKDTVISTHKWSVNVRNYMENTWTRLETVPEEMVVMLYIWMLIQLQPRQQVRWNMSNGLNEFTSKRVDEMCALEYSKNPPFQKTNCCSALTWTVFRLQWAPLKSTKRSFCNLKENISLSYKFNWKITKRNIWKRSIE